MWLNPSWKNSAVLKAIRPDATIDWQKLIEAGSWSAARDKGWLRMEGKNYIMHDGDVEEIHHS